MAVTSKQSADGDDASELTADLGGPARLRAVPAPWGETPITIVAPPGSRHGSFYVGAPKRLLDIVVAAVALVAALPILLALGVAIRLTMGGPVLFRQVRIGRNGEPFEILKFRTMQPDRRRSAAVAYAGEDRRRTHKPARHPLMTPLGRILRAYSLDEIPQLVNVLRGDMSLVGPRPELPSVTWNYEAWQHGRMLVRPGLTGLWQITARGDQPMHERTDLDIEYVRQVSLRHDLRILAATPRAMFGAHKGH